jgi:hypothetical protein
MKTSAEQASSLVRFALRVLRRRATTFNVTRNPNHYQP